MAAELESNLLTVRSISVFRHATLAVDRVSLEVGRSSWFGLIGANGSGKTSLLRAIAGRLSARCDSLTIDGVELAQSPEERARLIGFMPPAEFLPTALTGREVLTLLEAEPSKWRAGIRGIAEALAIDSMLDLPIGHCSAGMKQRIAICCAFATNSTIVILDEPFNWLDPVAAVDLRMALRSRVEEGLTLVTALHDMLSLVACDNGLVLSGGKIASNIDNKIIKNGRENPFAFEKYVINALRSRVIS